jgi:hypothetical protein
MLERLKLLSAFQALSLGGAYGISEEEAVSVIGQITGVYLEYWQVPPASAKSLDDYMRWLAEV